MVNLEASQLFSQLNPADLAAVKGIAQERRFAAGQEVFHEGDQGDGLFVLKSGRIEISARLGQDGARRAFSQIGAGDMLGEMAVIEDKPRSASAIAVQDTEVYFFPRAEMRALVEKSPGLALTFLRAISQRLRDFNRQYVNEVLQAERLSVIGRFARSIVHDLKNPLNIIGLTAEITGMPNADASARAQGSTRIRRQVDRISEMIGEILEFTEGTPTNFILAPTNYAEFVQPLFDELKAEVALKSAALELHTPPPTVEVPMNPKRLRRVFWNLVHNATDAMPQGGRILIRFEVRPHEVVTEVEDSGPGLPPEMAGRLFEAFATHGKAHGTGLGLSICKRIMEDHQGWINARNEKGRGAVFAFGLPQRRREAQG